VNGRHASLLVFLASVVLAAGVASRFSAGQWYVELVKPSWTSPPWILAGAGVIAYFTMALAAWRVWETRRPARLDVLIWWVLQLVLYTAWFWLFFGLERPGWAWMELSLLIVVVIFCARAFYRLSRPASWLLAPYLLWLVYAWFLNLSVWSMNGGYLARFFG